LTFIIDGSYTEALHHPTLKDNDKAFSCKASVTPWGILPAQPVIFVTLQQMVIKVNAGTPQPIDRKGIFIYLSFRYI
jgi:hypothetical protein